MSELVLKVIGRHTKRITSIFWISQRSSNHATIGLANTIFPTKVSQMTERTT